MKKNTPKKLLPLPLAKLQHPIRLNKFSFKTTADIAPKKEILAQNRSLKSLEFGLGMEQPGYNIYLCGLAGTGKMTTVQSFLEKISPTKAVPKDWCYVCNFKSPENPMILSFPPGKGKLFKKQIENLIEFLKKEVPAAFESKDYEEEIEKILKTPNEEKNIIFEEMRKKAEAMGFLLKTTKAGIITLPLQNLKPISEYDYNQLPEETRKEIEKKRSQLEPLISEILKKMRGMDNKIQEEIKQLEHNVILFIVKQRVDDIRVLYPNEPSIQDYLNQIEEDIVEAKDFFKKQELPVPLIQKKFLQYTVNLVVNNFETQGAPIIFEPNPTYYNLSGKIEKYVEFGSYATDFTKIKGGALARANGGYLIINAIDLMRNISAWDVLKRCLKNKQVIIEDLGEYYNLFPTSGIRPQPIPLNVKVILMGSSEIYHLLYNFDEEFHKIFKIRVDFNTETEASIKNLWALVKFIAYRCHTEKLKHVDRGGIERLVEYSSRLTSHQKKLSLQMNEINSMLLEAHYWASIHHHPFITREDVECAVHEKIYRSNLLEETIQKEILEGTLIINTEGKVCGQLNGLTVYSIGDYQFGWPARITAQTFSGERGIISIEREAKMSGKIHNKGVLILSGYLGSTYAQSYPLSISASVCFEQLYGLVDGDSASVAELYCLLSSIAQVPMRQDIGITGSINQRGEVQPIGGVNEKIEGFFYTCKTRGLTGTQGVILPHQNVDHLILRKEVIEAIKKKKFHLYAIRHVDEGISLLTGMAAEKFHHLISKKLQEYSEQASKKIKR